MEQEQAARIARYVGVAVLLIGPILKMLRDGPAVLGDFAFWFGLFGWLSAGIAIGYVVYLLLQLGARSSET